MNMTDHYHLPVLADASIEGLALKAGGTYLDCTVGGGGHFCRILEGLGDQGTIVGIDRDLDALKWTRKKVGNVKVRMILEQSTFSHFDTVLKNNGISSIDGILLDLGVSSYQIDTPERGFSYKHDAPLDMRMNEASGKTAETVLAESDEETLAEILGNYGEIRNPHRMARTIKQFTRKRRMVTSGDLRECLESEYGSPIKFKVLSKVFQALRIVVNDELDELTTCLSKVAGALNKGGRLVVIAYHSLEDRIVKNFIAEQEKDCICQPRGPLCCCDKVVVFKRVNRKAIHATPEEIAVNPRARSARLRIAEKVSEGNVLSVGEI